MALPLYDRAIETADQDLVRLTLIEGGASRQLIDALIPTRPLEADEQYRFHFDMTKCIGCRSCEVACNEQNGNPAEIKWRRVGELEGGTYPDTLRTYLSMGCNHCITAECVKGCPVDAYTKDPVTGIVLHSADACIGCQYCVWNCPYSVPVFNPERGVVGKCDMCRGRLAEGLEPACVNACPEDAIQIEIVNKIAWQIDFAQAEAPGMPAARHSLSTTRITLPEGLASEQLARVDLSDIRPEHAHLSLVIMTTILQAVVGALAALVVFGGLNALTLTLLSGLTALALNVSVFHLGRPAYAWRALKMWRRSWLSREVLLFGLFFLTVFATTAAAWLTILRIPYAAQCVTPLAALAVLFGVLGHLASAFIYLVPARPAWNMLHTPVDFLLSSAMIGLVLAELLVVWAPAVARLLLPLGVVIADAPIGIAPALLLLFPALWTLNLAIKVLRLRRAPLFELRASYALLCTDRFSRVSTVAGMAALAALALSCAGHPLMAVPAAVAAVALARYLFFVSVVPLNMGLTFLRPAAGGHG